LVRQQGVLVFLKWKNTSAHVRGILVSGHGIFGGRHSQCQSAGGLGEFYWAPSRGPLGPTAPQPELLRLFVIWLFQACGIVMSFPHNDCNDVDPKSLWHWYFGTNLG